MSSFHSKRSSYQPGFLKLPNTNHRLARIVGCMHTHKAGLAMKADADINSSDRASACGLGFKDTSSRIDRRSVPLNLSDQLPLGQSCDAIGAARFAGEGGTMREDRCKFQP
jgi:hypothetical protein